ncbi:MAG: hypothetical protein LBM02_09045 [Lachnospiraceae bacterium]|jgi:hypothetical protein|nr:hypothetical protein [Lachnospiraceae bacterium]
MNKQANNILIKAAKEWNTLLNKQLIITYGYKRQLNKIILKFNESDFYHLAGFHKLTDTRFPKYLKPNKLLHNILENTITLDYISKSIHFNEILPRLNVLSNINEIIKNDFSLFYFRPQMLYSFSSNIKAEYIITSNIRPYSYVFLIHTNDKVQKDDLTFVCISVFEKETNDFTENQRQRIILKKELINTKNNSSIILFDKLNG